MPVEAFLLAMSVLGLGIALCARRTASSMNVPDRGREEAAALRIMHGFPDIGG